MIPSHPTQVTLRRVSYRGRKIKRKGTGIQAYTTYTEMYTAMQEKMLEDALSVAYTVYTAFIV